MGEVLTPPGQATGAGGPSAPPSSATGASQALPNLALAIAELERAAMEWGIRPHHLEGQFVRAQIGAYRMLGGLITAAAADVHEVVAATKAAATTELQQLTQANRQVQMQLQQVDAVRAAFSVKAEQAAAEMIDRLVPQISKGVSQAVVVKQLRYNQAVQWGRATGIAATVLGLMLVSYCWRAYQDSPATAAIEHCLKERVNDTKTGKGYCPVESLLPGRE